DLPQKRALLRADELVRLRESKIRRPASPGMVAPAAYRAWFDRKSPSVIKRRRRAALSLATQIHELFLGGPVSPSNSADTIVTPPVEHRHLANAIRALAMDAVEKAKSGHPGLPMGAADVATVLFSRFLKFDAGDPRWPDRDRFVLSAGHGS